jgi:hypothetical protein
MTSEKERNVERLLKRMRSVYSTESRVYKRVKTVLMKLSQKDVASLELFSVVNNSPFVVEGE